MSSTVEQVKAWKLAKRGAEPPYHGTAHIYEAYRCTCDECRAAHARRVARIAARRAA